MDIDRLAIRFLELERKVDEAYKIATDLDEPHAKMKGDLICLVDEFGSAHAEKSKILHGLQYEMVGTFGASTSIDAAAVQRFATALAVAKQQKLMSKLFEQTVRYSLRSDAASIVRAVGLPKHLCGLFAQCQVMKPRTPTLKVRKIVAE